MLCLLIHLVTYAGYQTLILVWVIFTTSLAPVSNYLFPQTRGSSFQYRSYKKLWLPIKKIFDARTFPCCWCFDDIHNSFDFTDKLLNNAVNEHAPLTHWGRVTHICLGKLTWTAPSHYLNQCWNIVYWTLRNKLQWNFNRNSNIFIVENTFENVVCEMLFTSSRPQSCPFLYTAIYVELSRWHVFYNDGITRVETLPIERTIGGKEILFRNCEGKQ